jgi:hypothetical protein
MSASIALACSATAARHVMQCGVVSHHATPPSRTLLPWPGLTGCHSCLTLPHPTAVNVPRHTQRVDSLLLENGCCRVVMQVMMLAPMTRCHSWQMQQRVGWQPVRRWRIYSVYVYSCTQPEACRPCRISRCLCCACRLWEHKWSLMSHYAPGIQRLLPVARMTNMTIK